MNWGEVTGVPCPKECGGEIVYNGTYFCNNWTFPYAGQGCRWRLEFDSSGEPATNESWRVWRAIRVSAWFNTAIAAESRFF